MSRAETSARNYDPALMENIPIWLKHLDPTGAINQQVIVFDGALGEWVNGYGGGLIGSTSGITSNPTPGITHETWIGYQAGNGASDNYTVFVGIEAGNGALDAAESTIIGHLAGKNAYNAASSVYIGKEAGYDAFGASQSVLIGQNAGKNADNAKNSIFIGYEAGLNDTVDNSSIGTSILIGKGTSTGGFSDSIAFGEGATNTKTNQTFFANSLTNFHHNLQAFADNAAALAGGLVAGDWYYTNIGGDGIVKIVI